MAIWSLALAIWATAGTVGLFVLVGMASDSEAEVIGAVGGMVVLIPNLIGLGLGIASFERRTKNPGWVWLATIWNSATISIWALLIIVGILIG